MKALIDEYRRSLKRPETEEWADLYIYRPFGFLVVKAIYRTNITPNQLSLFSMVLGVLAGACFGLGRPGGLPVAALLLFLSIIVDCSDGQLARLKHNGTPLGRLIDGVSDYVVGVAIYIGLAFGFGHDSNQVLLWWLLVAAAAASNSFHSLVFDYYRNRYLDVVNGPIASDEDELVAFREELELARKQKRTMFRRLFLRTYIGYSRLQKRLTIGRSKSRAPRVANIEDFRRRNRVALRLWSFLGSSTQGTILIVAALVGRLDIYFWGMIVVRNILAVVMFIVQNRIDRTLSADPAV
jgi:phosphatidylglycerophosphate synthase